MEWSGVVETDIVRRTIPVGLIGAYESVMPRASGMCDIWWWISIVMCIKENCKKVTIIRMQKSGKKRIKRRDLWYLNAREYIRKGDRGLKEIRWCRCSITTQWW